MAGELYAHERAEMGRLQKAEQAAIAPIVTTLARRLKPFESEEILGEARELARGRRRLPCSACGAPRPRPRTTWAAPSPEASV
jgi:hypothetical protein